MTSSHFVSLLFMTHVSNLCVALALHGSIALALAPEQAVVWALELEVWKQLYK